MDHKPIIYNRFQFSKLLATQNLGTWLVLSFFFNDYCTQEKKIIIIRDCCIIVELGNSYVPFAKEKHHNQNYQGVLF